MLKRRLLPRLTKTSVIVHTREGKSFAGVLVGVYRDSLALAHAVLLDDSGTVVGLEGELVLPIGNVAFLQTGVELDASKGA